jgi:hypothetical protein
MLGQDSSPVLRGHQLHSLCTCEAAGNITAGELAGAVPRAYHLVCFTSVTVLYCTLILIMCHFLQAENMMCHRVKFINIGTCLQLHIN